MTIQTSGPVETPARALPAEPEDEQPFGYSAEIEKYRGLENRILDTVSGIAPWLAPIIPAYFAAYNAWQFLVKGHNLWDVLMVVVISLVVETVGLVGVHTALQFWNWNRIRRKTDGEAPLLLPIAAVVMYVAIVITVNGLLDYADYYDKAALPGIKIAVTALLSLLSLNSALVVALRAGQNDRVAKAAMDKAEHKADLAAKRAEKKARKLSESFGNLPSAPQQVSPYSDWRHVPHEERLRIAGMNVPDIMQAYQQSERTALNWQHNAQTYAAQYAAPQPQLPLETYEETGD